MCVHFHEGHLLGQATLDLQAVTANTSSLFEHTTEMSRANSVALLMLLVIGLFLQGLHDNTWDFWDGPYSLSLSLAHLCLFSTQG